ncbi:MAG TPA: zinc ribbon domain-containing protein [Candidatus Sulfotelmatobacter sp.]|jgi:DNA-directed RNA polymerase subunit RPC12/RpoP|nr:zinc ribbon domain-containing protein [Candidatus Sulfotelmatobacter sp.]
MRQTIIGLLMVALTAAGFYWVARHRYKCPFCGRNVKYDDINCPYCGNDMNYRHRAGPEKPPRAAADLRPSSRRRSSDRSSRT